MISLYCITEPLYVLWLDLWNFTNFHFIVWYLIVRNNTNIRSIEGRQINIILSTGFTWYWQIARPINVYLQKAWYIVNTNKKSVMPVIMFMWCVLTCHGVTAWCANIDITLLLDYSLALLTPGCPLNVRSSTDHSIVCVSWISYFIIESFALALSNSSDQQQAKANKHQTHLVIVTPIVWLQCNTVLFSSAKVWVISTWGRPFIADIYWAPCLLTS